MSNMLGMTERALNNRPQLLLIDDDRKLARLLTDYLQSHGFDISAAHDGAEGLALARSQEWDLIILDVMLPAIDGHAVLAQLRRHFQTPVLMLTGRGTERDLIAGLEGGADDYLPKTASSRELVTRIRALLRRAATASAGGGAADAPTTELTIGALTLLPASRSAHVGGKAIALTGVEYDLLSHLMRYKGQIRTREQLLREVRNRELESFDRAIDVHVASLRKKLGDDSRSSRFIRTVRAAGYLFIDPSVDDA
jgi:DNA-binding response OmpR family regulator